MHEAWMGAGGAQTYYVFETTHLCNSPLTHKDAATWIMVSMCYQGESMCNPCKLIQK